MVQNCIKSATTNIGNNTPDVTQNAKSPITSNIAKPASMQNKSTIVDKKTNENDTISKQDNHSQQRTNHDDDQVVKSSNEVNKMPEAKETKYVFEDDDSTADLHPLNEYDDEIMRDEYDDCDEDEMNESGYGGGIRERSLLCPILEEDAESTASTSSLLNLSKQTKYMTPTSKFDDHELQNHNDYPTNSNGNNSPTTTKDCELLVIDDEQQNHSLAMADEVHDGHYFIRLIENEIFKFEEQICDFEEDLASTADNTSMTSPAIPEDIRDSILAAVGKAKLLMGQKMMQFRGLCDKNIAAMDPNSEPDPFVPTSQDLAGFWDMVYIQVEHIHSMFAELKMIRSNGWKIPEKTNQQTDHSKANVSDSVSRTAVSNKKKKPIRPFSTTRSNLKKNITDSNDENDNKNTSKKSEAAKARDEARKKMMAEKKKKMMELKQKQNKEANDNDDECKFIQF